MKCNLIVPGFAKSGTSSLHAYLDQHPHICMSRIKEPHFFTSDKNFARGLHWHDALFSDCSERVSWYGESSTSYAVWEPALVRIKDELASPKFIVLVRHPVDRLLSHYRWMYALGLEKKPLQGALEEEIGRDYDFDSGGRKGNFPWYLRHSRYSYFGAKLNEMFGRDNVLFLRSNDLLQDPGRALDRCWGFLNLAEVVPVETIHSNRTEDTRIQRTLGLDWIVGALPAGIGDALDRHGKIRRIVKNVLGTYRRAAPLPREQELEWLAQELVPDIEFFENIPSVLEEPVAVSREQGKSR